MTNLIVYIIIQKKLTFIFPKPQVPNKHLSLKCITTFHNNYTKMAFAKTGQTMYSKSGLRKILPTE